MMERIPGHFRAWRSMQLISDMFNILDPKYDVNRRYPQVMLTGWG